MTKRIELAKAIGVTAELTGTELSTDVLHAMMDELERYPEEWVAGALMRCRRELRYKLTLADILTRMDDGRPGVEQAWAMCPRTEAVTVVWTEETAAAWGAASPLIFEGDEVAARMAFKEAYLVAVQKAREGARPVKWSVTLGHDPHGRETPILEAVKYGRITAQHAANLLPYRDEPSEAVKQLVAQVPKQLEHAE